MSAMKIIRIGVKVQMSDNPVLRRTANLECGQAIGQLHIKLKNAQPGRDFETVSFYCNQPWNHRTPCMFIGKDVSVIRTPS